MYAPPQSFKNLVRDLKSDAGSAENARLLVHVELTLHLVMRLGLESEPLTVGWVLLSRMPLHHILLERLTTEQQRMLANAGVIVPLSSRFAWENALTRYAKHIPESLRLYNITLDGRLDKQMVGLCLKPPSPDPKREELYESILNTTLSYEKRHRYSTSSGKTYHVHVRNTDGTMHNGNVQITDEMHTPQNAKAWFEDVRPRSIVSVSHNDLMPTAQFLDEREQATGGRVHWVHDLREIRFQHATYNEGRIQLEPINAHPIHLEGTVHLPGMVSAGKTTLAKLIIAHCIRMGWNVRITLVVGDSHSALEIAHQVNSWFYDDPAGEDVVAVPLLGTSQRKIHLERLLNSREYSRSLESGKTHWGERWLMPVCPLASHIQWEGNENITIMPGYEPCEKLISQSSRGEGRMRHVCPLFHTCPSKQMFRDMPQAQLWITTPGALSQAALPLHLDERFAKLGDLVYDQSDLVILDEVETLVDWFDRTFAKEEALTNGKDGLLDRLDTQITQYWRENRVLIPDYRRWVIATREAIKALASVLTAIVDPTQKRAVKDWVESGYFSANRLAFRFARRLAGIKESDGVKASANERAENEKLVQPIFEPFNLLLNRIPDPLRYQAPTEADPIETVAGELAAIMQALNNLADDIDESDGLLPCKNWILHWYPDIENRISTLSQKLAQSQEKSDQKYLKMDIDRSVDEMAQRLQFLLTVALLDRHIHIVIDEWHNKPETIEAQQPFSRIPQGMKNILPLPPIGQQYSFIINNDAPNRLSMFAYTNIGRSYLLNFTKLRQSFDGLPGPHVLALSGTSCLPDSTAFHVSIPPAGILIAPDKTEQAIRDSHFIWQYFVDSDGKPIHISGKGNKEQQLRLLIDAMLRYGGLAGGFLGDLLNELEQQGTVNPDQWDQRSRILLLTNSYPQARVVADSLRNGWRSQALSIYHLNKGVDKEDYEITTVGQNGELRRMDIEGFADIDGRILVAPMQSIGRGFNILNKNLKAAFGAVCFLTRPLPPPYNRELAAQELNRYALQWAADPKFVAWAEDTLYQRAISARSASVELRRLIEQRRGYADLRDLAELQLTPRKDLAATTAGQIIQAVGRLLRGGVPFRAYFVDAAWSPRLASTGSAAEVEDEGSSLLTAMINVLDSYTVSDVIGQRLYGSLTEALMVTENRDNN